MREARYVKITCLVILTALSTLMAAFTSGCTSHEHSGSTAPRPETSSTLANREVQTGQAAGASKAGAAAKEKTGERGDLSVSAKRAALVEWWRQSAKKTGGRNVQVRNEDGTLIFTNWSLTDSGMLAQFVLGLTHSRLMSRLCQATYHDLQVEYAGGTDLWHLNCASERLEPASKLRAIFIKTWLSTSGAPDDGGIRDDNGTLVMDVDMNPSEVRSMYVKRFQKHPTEQITMCDAGFQSVRFQDNATIESLPLHCSLFGKVNNGIVNEERWGSSNY